MSGRRARPAPDACSRRPCRAAPATALLLAGLTLLAPSRRAAAAPADAPIDAVADRLVSVLVTYQEYNPFLPWQTGQPQVRLGYGVVLNDRQVLTTEYLVRNSTLVELREPQSGDKIPAIVAIADVRLNLAILNLPEPRPSLAPLDLAGAPRLGDTVRIVQLNDDAALLATDARVTQISMGRLPNAPETILTHSLISDLHVSFAGAPVAVDGKLAGLIFNYQADTRIASMISAPIVQRFIEDAATPPYLGSATAGFTWRPLIDPTKRAFLKLGGETGGIQIDAPMIGTGAHGVLEPLDVILTWDGFALDNLGFYDDPEFGRLSFAHLVKSRRTPGDMVPLTVLRQGERLDLRLPLGGSLEAAALVPENVTGEKPSYMIVGGLVLRELDVHYLRSHGNDWRGKVDARLMHIYLNGPPDDHRIGDRVVILANVLPDPINVGYHHLRNDEVLEANGQPVDNMNDVFRIADTDGRITRLRLQAMGVDVALDPYEIFVADRRLAEQYRIPALRYERPSNRNP